MVETNLIVACLSRLCGERWYRKPSTEYAVHSVLMAQKLHTSFLLIIPWFNIREVATLATKEHVSTHMPKRKILLA